MEGRDFEKRSCLKGGVVQNVPSLMSEQTSVTAKDQGHLNLLILLSPARTHWKATVIVGPMLPVFIQKWSLDDRQAGFFFTVQFNVVDGWSRTVQRAFGVARIPASADSGIYAHWTGACDIECR